MTRVTFEDIKRVLTSVEMVRERDGLSRRQVAEALGIPFNTFRAWFHRTPKTPSMRHLSKLEAFVTQRERALAAPDELCMKIREWWRVQHRYASLEALAEDVGWCANALGECLERTGTPPRIVLERLASLAGVELPGKVRPAAEVRRRIAKLKAILVILAEELAWFRDGPPEVREAYRSELDHLDIGYVSSLLIMMTDEGKFNRWRALTTARFGFLESKGGGR